MRYNSRLGRPLFAVMAILALAAASAVMAQSSGNFAAQVSTSQCVINTIPNSATPGSLSGGGGTLLDTTIKTPNSQFTTLLITPSLVTGLFNNTAATQDMQSSANSAAVVVKVTLDGNPVAPATSSEPNVIYDQRFQQLSANNFDAFMSCSLMNNCSVDLVESTLAAHSFNFVAPNVGGGVHNLKVEWAFVCSDNTGTNMPCQNTFTVNSSGACAGPGTVTVQQVKAFTQSGGVTVGP